MKVNKEDLNLKEWVMRTMFILSMFLICGGVYSQEVDRVLEYQKDKDIVKVSYFDEDDNLVQEGYFNVQGKLEGRWISYNDSGKKQVLATYKDNLKDGIWLFVGADSDTEVTYKRGVVMDVKKRSKKQVLAQN